MLDTYDFNGDVWLCHSFEGQCHDITAFVCKIIHLILFLFYVLQAYLWRKQVWKIIGYYKILTCDELTGTRHRHTEGNWSFSISKSNWNCHSYFGRLCSCPKWFDKGLHWSWSDEVLVSTGKHAKKWSRLASGEWYGFQKPKITSLHFYQV